MTEHGKYRLTVKEGTDGQPWLMFEPSGREITVLKRRQLGLDLNPGCTLEDARALARDLARHVVGLRLSSHIAAIE